MPVKLGRAAGGTRSSIRIRLDAARIDEPVAVQKKENARRQDEQKHRPLHDVRHGVPAFWGRTDERWVCLHVGEGLQGSYARGRFVTFITFARKPMSGDQRIVKREAASPERES